MRVYLFSPIPFTFLHQRPQNIAEELLRQSVDVTYVEPFGLTEFFAGRKKLRLRDPFIAALYHLIGLWKLLFPRPNRSPRPVHRPLERFEVLTFPFVVPSNRFNSPFLDRLNGAVYRAWLRRTLLGREGCTTEDVALIQQPYLGFVIERGDFTRIYYDCIDDPAVFSGRGSRERVLRAEEDLLSLADGVFVTSAKLEEEIQRRFPRISLTRIPNGVPVTEFRNRANQDAAPKELIQIRGTIAGYVGILRLWFDYRLIERLAGSLPEINFVLVGPYDETADTRRLKQMPNVFFLGRKPYREIPSFVKRFNVCLIPFLPGDIAETTNPVKIFEYFALGKPVVATRLRELEPFRDEGLVLITDHDGCVAAVREAIAETDESRPERRRAIAAEHSWENLVRRMRQVMENGVPE